MTMHNVRVVDSVALSVNTTDVSYIISVSDWGFFLDCSILLFMIFLTLLSYNLYTVKVTALGV